MVAVALDEVTKVFPGGLVAVDRLSVDVAPGELFVLLGPTGCGKSTVLRMIAGLDQPTSGSVLIDGEVVNDVPAQDRRVGMVFQHYALHPHLTVAEIIALPLRVARTSTDDVRARVASVAALLGIEDLLHRNPAVLSGGQRQRTAMARAILRDPRVFLLDEPLSNLDAGVRAELRGEISRLTRRLAATTIYVTHDQVEAMTMADRVAVLRRGVLQQVGTPHDVYEEPRTVFVAAFLGTPRINLVQAAVYARPGGGVDLDLGAQRLRLDAADPLAAALAAALAAHHNDRVTVGLRPEALHPAASGSIHGRVRLVEHLGHELIVHLDSDSVPAAPETVGQELPARHLADAMTGKLPAGGPLHQLRDFLVPHQRRPEQAPTAKTEYGFYPAYDVVPAPHLSDLVVRLAAGAAPPVVGETMALDVDLRRLMVFDRAGQRIG